MRIFWVKQCSTALLLTLMASPLALAQTAVPPQDAATRDTLSSAAIDARWTAAMADYAPARSALLAKVDATVAHGPFQDDWQSLSHDTVPDWYRDAKFGIFIHWGVFSVPAFGSEWYSRDMYQPGKPEYAHHRAVYGPQTSFGYKDFIPQFRMEHFNPEAWATLFRQAGARYVVPVAEHHDGFALYNCSLTQWNAVKMGPKRDLVGDLAAAVRAQDMKFGTSYHRAEHDWFFDGGRSFASDVNDPHFASLYGPAQQRVLQGTDDVLSKDFTFVSKAFRDDWLARTAEIVDRYHPDLVYFDWWVGQPDFRATERSFAAFYYNNAAQHGQQVVMNYKYDNMLEHSGVLDVERGQLAGIRPEPWQTDTSISNASWGYIEGDTYKQPVTLIHQLVDVVSKNGNLLLNIGPRSDGTIPEPAQKILLAIGGWLSVNGEAIYGTRPWSRFGEGPTSVATGAFADKADRPFTAQDFRFTTHDDLLYAIELGWPKSGESVIHSLTASSAQVQEVSLLGYEGKLQWHQDAEGLHIDLPDAPVGEYAFAFRIRLKT